MVVPAEVGQPQGPQPAGLQVVGLEGGGPRVEEEVGEDQPGDAEQGGGHEGEHPEEDGEGLQPPLEGDRERGELDPQNLHFYKSSADCPAALAWDRFSLGNN